MEAASDGGDSPTDAVDQESFEWIFDTGDDLEEQRDGSTNSAEDAIVWSPVATTTDPDASAAPALPAPPVAAAEPTRPAARAKRQRRNYGSSALAVDQVEALMGQNLPPRPLILDVSAGSPFESGWFFKETGKRSRPSNPRADRWRQGGGTTEATDLPSSEEPCVRRRYGYLIPKQAGSARLRYHQYNRLVPVNSESGAATAGNGLGVEEDLETSLFHVLPGANQAQQLVPAAARVATTESDPVTKVIGSLYVDAKQTRGNGTPLLQLSSAARPAGQVTDFIRFEEAGSEVGGLYHSDHGLQLRSAAGDFAEWHPALDPSELPFEEGSVVGVFSGRISLRTTDADMVAVVSRRALCVGSFPGKEKAVRKMLFFCRAI